MSGAGEVVLLGVIALATLTTAVVELLVIVWLVRAGRRTSRAVDRLSRQVAPLRAHAQAIGEHLTRARFLASAQLNRAASAAEAVARPIQKLAIAVTVARGVSGVLGRRRSRRRGGTTTPSSSS